MSIAGVHMGLPCHGSSPVVGPRVNATPALLQEAEQFVRANRFPQSLRARIKAYYAFAAEHGVGDHDARLVGGLSLQLRQDVLLSMHYRLLRSMPFFAAQPTSFMLRIVQVLAIIAVPPGEFVVMQVRLRARPFLPEP